jgi:hypothetical protein
VSPSSSPCSEKKVLTTYEIHHKWIRPFHHFPPFHSFNRHYFPCTYGCTLYLQHIYPPSAFPTSSPFHWFQVPQKG